MTVAPTHLDRFKIVRVLGRGGMGTVYLARDERLDRLVALKVLSSEVIPDRERAARFLREARAAAAIRHPNIATVYEVGETEDGIPFIAMEYCEGDTLSRLATDHRIDSTTWLLLARQIAEGLSAAHAKGILHRDVKSANIIVEENRLAKILDFGLAKVLEPHEEDGTLAYSSSGHFFGTVPYISPEQARGGTADTRSDLFSLGVVFYEMACGVLPFDADSPLALLDKIRHEEPRPFVPIDPSFPPEAATIIGRLLQKDPDERYQTAEDLVHDLSEFSRELTTARQKKLSTAFRKSQLGRTIARRPIRRFTLALIGAVLLAGGIAAVYFRNRDLATASPKDTTIRSVAVMPFQNVSGNEPDDFLSIGLADALVTRLQQIPQLQVRPTSAVVDFQNRAIDVKKAGAKLEVDGVLEGRFITSGPQVRVNLQLTDSRSGYGVWAGSVDGNRQNLLALMDEVSSRAALALNRNLGPQSPGGASAERTTSPEAYELFLKARALQGSLVQEQSDAQVQHLKRAIQLDPKFAAAHAELAVALSLRQIRGFDRDPKILTEAEWYARQAVRLDPNLPSAHLALSKTLVRSGDRFREAMRENLAALRLNPNDPQSLYGLVTYFVSTGELQKAGCAGDRLVRIDPSSNDVKARGYWNVNAVDPEGMIEMSRVALASPETALGGHDMLCQAYLLRGDVEAAAAEQRRAAEIGPDHYIGKSLRAMVAAARNDRAEAEAAIRTFSGEARSNHYAAVRIGLVYAKLGRTKDALRWLDLAAKSGNHNWYFYVKHPWLNPLQGNAEYQATIGWIRADLDDVRDDVIGVYDLICGEDSSAAGRSTVAQTR